jgi:post-segregation antitoxin (ccd killing protein)
MAEPTERIAILLELEQQAFEKKAKSAGAAIDRLERKFTPLAAAEAKLEKQQLRFNAALEAGTIDAAQHAKGMDLVQREYDQTIARSKKVTSNVVAMNSAVAAQTGFMARNRNLFQQGGYQVGDFAVQVQGGTSALTAFTQQGSQFLGIFGPWGAVMGAILAVGAPLAGVLWNLGDATEETKEKAKTFTERLGEADAALAAMSSTAANVSDLETLRQKYGELTQEVQDMALALLDIDRREAVAKVSGVITEVTAQIAKAAESTAGTVSAALASAGTDAGIEAAEEVKREIERLELDISLFENTGQPVPQALLTQLVEMKEELAAVEGRFEGIGTLVNEINVSPDLLKQISEAQAGLEAARDAGDFSAMADQLGAIRDLLIEAGDTVNQDVLDGVTNAEAVAREMATRLDEGKEAAEGIARVDLAGGISAGVDEAAKLAKNFGIALNLARQIAAEQAAPEKPKLGYNLDGGGRNPIPNDVTNAKLGFGKLGVKNPPTTRFDVPNLSGSGGVADLASGGGSSGGGRSRSGSGGRSGGRDQEPLFSIAEDELEKLKRSMEMLGKSKGEVAALTVKHKLLDEAKKRGLDITEELTAQIDAEAGAVGKLAEEYDLARDKIAAMEKIQGEFKDSVIDAAMGGVDAMDAFTNSIKRAALEYLLFGEGMFAGGGSKSGGGFGGLLGGVFAGMFDKGGKIPSGKFGIAGENGPEIVRGPAMVTSTRATAAAMQSGGGQMDVRVYVDDDGNWQAKVEQISGGVVQNAAPGIVGQSVNASQRSFKNSKSGWSP